MLHRRLSIFREELFGNCVKESREMMQCLQDRAQRNLQLLGKTAERDVMQIMFDGNVHQRAVANATSL